MQLLMRSQYVAAVLLPLVLLYGCGALQMFTNKPGPIKLDQKDYATPLRKSAPKAVLEDTSQERAEGISQYNQGRKYEQGDTVPVDMQAAYSLYLNAAENNIAAAQVRVGQMLDRGIGVEQNLTEARKWWIIAAVNNEPYASKLLLSNQSTLPPLQQQDAEALARDWLHNRLDRRPRNSLLTQPN